MANTETLPRLRFSLRLPVPLAEKIDRLAYHHRMTKTDVLLDALGVGLSQVKDPGPVPKIAKKSLSPLE